MNTILLDEIVSPVASGSAPCVSVIVPLYNEQATVATALECVFNEPTVKEIIVVDDGSSDESAAQIAKWIRSVSSLNDSTWRIVSLQHAENRGKGSAIKTALNVARGEFVIVQDADLEVRPSCYAALLSPLIGGTAEFVMGCRSGGIRSQRSFHAIGVRVLGAIVRILYGYHVHDAACCFKVVSLVNLKRMNLECERFEFCPEVIAKASKLGLVLQQVDVEYFPRGVTEGKKLRLLKDGLAAIQTLLRHRRWREPVHAVAAAPASSQLSALEMDVPEAMNR